MINVNLQKKNVDTYEITYEEFVKNLPKNKPKDQWSMEILNETFELEGGF